MKVYIKYIPVECVQLKDFEFKFSSYLIANINLRRISIAEGSNEAGNNLIDKIWTEEKYNSMISVSFFMSTEKRRATPRGPLNIIQ